MEEDRMEEREQRRYQYECFVQPGEFRRSDPHADESTTA